MRSAIGPQGLSLTRVARLLEQVGQALTAAHEQGICHRDLKPENIMLRDVRDGRDLAMLIDFGIAAVPDRNDTTARGTRLAGTFPYMAPEQMSGAPGHFSDIFAMGVIAYEMVTGKLPFVLLPHDPPMRLWFLQRDGAPTGPLETRGDLPAAPGGHSEALAFSPKTATRGPAISAARSPPLSRAERRTRQRMPLPRPTVSAYAGPAARRRWIRRAARWKWRRSCFWTS
jgi:serine/threonine-protein kinase